MTTEIGFNEIVKMLKGACEAIKNNHELLSTLDTKIGDGDHGVTMLRAVNKADASLASGKHTTIKGVIDDVAWIFMGIDGGATGPLYGSLFLGMTDVLSDQQTLDGPALASVFEAGLAYLQKQSKAKIGDKTMMDALIPAVAAMRMAADQGKSIEEMLQAAAEAAEKGAISTKDMVARVGRAKNQGERTIGTQDPGATSTLLIFQGFRDGLK